VLFRRDSLDREPLRRAQAGPWLGGAIGLVGTVLDRTGIFDQLNGLVKDISGAGGGDLRSVLGLGQVMGFSLVVGILDIVVVTALGAVFALLYNLSVKITGGLLVGFTNN